MYPCDGCKYRQPSRNPSCFWDYQTRGIHKILLWIFGCEKWEDVRVCWIY